MFYLGKACFSYNIDDPFEDRSLSYLKFNVHGLSDEMVNFLHQSRTHNDGLLVSEILSFSLGNCSDVDLLGVFVAKLIQKWSIQVHFGFCFFKSSFIWTDEFNYRLYQ